MPFQSEKQRKYLHANHLKLPIDGKKITKRVDPFVLQSQGDVVK